MNWVDYVIFGILIFATLIGFWRGLVGELIVLVIWVVAFALSIVFSPWLADKMTQVFSEPNIRLSLAFVAIFIGVLVAGNVVFNLLVGPSISPAQLNPGSRLVGALFGLIRGGLMVGVLLLLGQMLNFNSNPAWQSSQVIPYFIKIQENPYMTGMVLNDTKVNK